MPRSFGEYKEKIRLYQEIMKKANQIGDHHLVGLIKKKQISLYEPECGPGELILFPASDLTPAHSPIPLWRALLMAVTLIPLGMFTVIKLLFISIFLFK